MCAALVVLILAPGADADSPGYVTRHEYHRVETGWTKRHVHRVFDTHGVAVEASGTRQTRVYRGWKAGVEVYVRYRLEGRWRVVRKWAMAEVVVS